MCSTRPPDPDFAGALAALLLLVGACAAPDDDDSSPADDDDSAGGDDDDDDASPEVPPYLSVLGSPADLALLSDGGALKYIAPTLAWEREPPITEDCYFQDMARWPWHLQFLRTLPGLESLDAGTYEAWVVQPDSRIWWGGAVQLWPGAVHPVSGEPGVLGFVLYSNSLEPGLDVEQLLEINGILSTCVPFAAEFLVWVPDGSAQRAWAEANQEGLSAAGVFTVFAENLAPGVASTTYSAGEGYGTLRIVPQGEDLLDYGPTDVVVMTQAPNDMSIVSGLLTSAPQNLHSHINLRLREKGIPSASVPAIYENALVAALDGLLVHVLAPEEGEGSVVVEPATLADAQAFWDSRYPELPAIELDLSVTELAPFAAMSHDDATAYGAKAANLGELRNALPARNRRDGFGIPFSAYEAHIKAAGIDSEIEDLLADPRVFTDRPRKEARLDDLRDAIREAPLAPDFLGALETAIRARFRRGAESTMLRFRSSSSVEDLGELTGAGLYDSRSGCLGDDLDGDEQGPSRCYSPADLAWIESEIQRWDLELAADPGQEWIAAIIEDLQEDLTQEKTVADAVRKVWRSIWNTRAFDERAWYGIDHRQAMMGIGVHPAFFAETAEGVLVTNLEGGTDGPLYRLVSQLGEIGVVRPADPAAVAEVLTFERVGDAVANPELLVQSNHAGEPIWSEAELDELAGAAFAVQDWFASGVYPEIQPLRLDMEIERMPDGSVIVKQVRPYVTWEPAEEDSP
jgi:hypothetical protein